MGSPLNNNIPLTKNCIQKIGQSFGEETNPVVTNIFQRETIDLLFINISSISKFSLHLHYLTKISDDGECIYKIHAVLCQLGKYDAVSHRTIILFIYSNIIVEYFSEGQLNHC